MVRSLAVGCAACVGLLTVFSAFPLLGQGAAWTLLDVPGAWEDAPGGQLAKYDGYAWYRCFVNVPAAWKGDDLSLTLHKIDNCHEAFVNGVKVGGQGSFPPLYRDGVVEQPGSYTAAAKLVRPGEYNLIAVRVYDHDGKGGFRGAPPFLGNETHAIALKGPWRFRTGDNLDWVKEKIDGTPKDATFFKVETMADVTRRFFPSGGTDPLTPAESLKRFKIADDLALDQVLAEPIVRQPLSLSFDERGRLWVVQYLQYPNPAGLKMTSRDIFWRVVYDKVPPPPPNHFKGADKITIHEDTDGDGVYDKHTTFLDDLSIVTSVARGRGGVWVLNPPYLLFYPDKNNDDVPDGDPEVHLGGFGLEDTHSVTNSLRWGPDGWLYASQGSTVSANVKRSGDKFAVHSMGQLIWRYHPETRRYEIFAEGGGNAFGVEIDSKGRVFSGHNGGNTRGFHYVQGGYYQKGFSKHGSLTNPYTFGYFNWMQHANVPRFTHTFVTNEGGNLPKRHDGKLFAVAPLQSHIVESDIFPHGSSFQTKDIGFPVTTTDTWFRPVDIELGPDGALYIADLYEGHIAHLRHFEGQVHRASGRVYRLRAKDATPAKPRDLSRLTAVELAGQLESPNRWVRGTALQLIGDRKDRGVVPLLKTHLRVKAGQAALEALWALNLSGGLDDGAAMVAMSHAEPQMRAWVIRLLGDRNQVSSRIAQAMERLAEEDAQPAVRSQLASSARRLPAEAALPIVLRLLGRSEDVDDIHIPLLLWWAIEAKAESDREHVLRLFDEPGLWDLPIVKKHILERVMRRFAQAGSQKDLRSCLYLLQRAPDVEHVRKLLTGFEQAFAGRSLANLPEDLVKELARRGGGSLALRLRLGQPDAVNQSLKLIADDKAEKNQRLSLMPILGQIKEVRGVSVLLQVVENGKPDDVRQTALTSLQSFDDARIAAAVLGLHAKLPAEVRTVADSLLASRKDWARQLLDAVDAGRIDKNALALDVVRRMTVHKDDRIAALVAKHWGKVQGATTAQMQARIHYLHKMIPQGDGTPYAGKKLFTASCAKCHTLFNHGGSIGPDLTTHKRDDLANMLLHIVNPSAEVREGFETHLVVTNDGRALTGFLVDQDNRLVVLRGADGQDISLARSQIDEMKVIPQSIMPEGLLDTLTDQQVRDLFAYLRSSQPLND